MFVLIINTQQREIVAVIVDSEIQYINAPPFAECRNSECQAWCYTF
jgi:hypothetical protein